MTQPAREEPDDGVAAPLTDRPWSLEKAWRRPFLEALSRMPNVSAACRLARVSSTTVYDEKKHDPEFAAAWQEALDVAHDLLEQIAHRRATVGETHHRITRRTKRDADGNLIEEELSDVETLEISDTMLMFLLRSYRPDRFRERVDHRHTGSDGGPVQVDVIERRPTRERMLELVQLAQEYELPIIDADPLALEPPPSNGAEPPPD